METLFLSGYVGQSEPMQNLPDGPFNLVHLQDLSLFLSNTRIKAFANGIEKMIRLKVLKLRALDLEDLPLLREINLSRNSLTRSGGCPDDRCCTWPTTRLNTYPKVWHGSRT
ncbi:MAG: hypothetical protein ACFB11_07060 [Paracoccaceae bacterium]